MPKGPQGQKRPADTNACAVMVARIATGEVEEDGKPSKLNNRANGGLVRSESLLPERRSEIARTAANARWAVREGVR
jgi:hypothetical protein